MPGIASVAVELRARSRGTKNAGERPCEMKRSLWGFLLDAILWSVAYFVLSFLALATFAAIFMVRPNSPLETYAVIIFSILVFAGRMFVLALALSTLLR